MQAAGLAAHKGWGARERAAPFSSARPLTPPAYSVTPAICSNWANCSGLSWLRQ